MQALEDLLEEQDVTLGDAIDGLAFVLANVMFQATEEGYDPSILTEVSELLNDSYKFYCGFEESANLTIQ